MQADKSIPKEIKPFYPLFDNYEKEQLSIFFNEISRNASLEEIKRVLLKVVKPDGTNSSCFMVSLGRILYHCYDFKTLQQLYEKTTSSEIGYWYYLLLVDYTTDEKEKEVLFTTLSQSEQAPIFSLLEILAEFTKTTYFVQATNFQKTIDLRINKILIEDIGNHSQNKEIFKIFYSYILFTEIKFYILRNEITIAKDLLLQTANIIQAIDDRIIEVYFLRLSALIEFRKNNFSTAQHLFLRSLALAEFLGEKRFIFEINTEIGDLYLQMGHIKDAKLFYDKSQTYLNEHLSFNSTLQGILLSKLADYYFLKEDFEKSILTLDQSLTFFKTETIFSFHIKLKYIEYLLNLKNVQKAEFLLNSLNENKMEFSVSEKSYIMYLQAFIELLKNNFGKSQNLLYSVISIADQTGDEWMSSKCLVLLLILLLLKYNLASKLDDIVEADKCAEDIITFLEEKAKFQELSLIYLIRAKIRRVLLDFDTSLYLLKTGETIAKQYFPELIEQYNEQVKLLSSLLEEQESSDIDSQKIDFKEDVNTIFQILLKQTKKLGSPIESITIAVLIFHSSGIPIRTYRSEELYISDDMIFGGFVSAIRHLLDELFYNQESKSLSVDHGQYKLLIEFYKNLFSIVVLTVRDSFLLRRKMHQLVNFIAAKDLFQERYSGKIDDLLLRDVDSFVEKLFKVKRN